MDDTQSEVMWLRTLFDGMEDVLFVHDTDGRILECNAAACSRLDYRRDELLNMYTRDLDAPEFAAGFAQRLETQLRHKRYRCEGIHLTKGGLPIHVDIHTTLIDFRGKPAILAVMRDITARKEAELEREALRTRVAQAEKMESLGVMAGGIAHDFNNLLMGVLGNANIAMLDAQENSKIRRCLEQIESAAQRAAALSQQMLAYSGHASLTFKKIDVSLLVRKAASALDAAVGKRCRIEYFLDGSTIVCADESQLRQVLTGLAANAAEAYGEGGGTIVLRAHPVRIDGVPSATPHVIGALVEGEYAVIEISDTGCGMDDRVIDRIFDPFFTTKFAGRGLGLAAVAGIVRGHRGAIAVTSAIGQGTTIRVYVPVVPSQSSDMPVGERCPRTSNASTILVVDDEEVVLDVSKRGLERAGYRVVTASNGNQALDIFRERHADIGLVVLDLTMPRMSGEETYRALKGVRGDVRVIVSSGYSHTDAAQRFRGEPIEEFLQKPYRARDLVSLVTRTLDSAGTPPTGRPVLSSDFQI